MTDGTAVWTRDFQSHSAKPDISALLRNAARSVTKNPLALTFDWLKIKKAPGRVNFTEYLDFRIYDRAAFSTETDRRRFLSNDLHWRLCYQCSDRKWDAVTEDKWISETLIRQSGIQTTNTLGILDKSGRSYGPTQRFENADHFSGFLTEFSRPVFAKINGGIASEGAMRITPLGNDMFDISGLGELSGENLFKLMMSAPNAYLIQEELKHHPEMENLFGSTISTIRAMTFKTSSGAHTPFFVLKLPSAGNIADNFWRKGNMLADIEPKSGKIRRLIRGKGPGMEILDRHPETGQDIRGAMLPLWRNVQNVIDDISSLYAPVKFQSVDLAITENGPKIVEINTGGAFDLPQIASGHGMLSDDFIELFQQAGGKLDISNL